MEEPTYHLAGVMHTRDELPADFDGPLSVILLLLSKNKIEIQDVSITSILEQYLAYLDEMKRLDMEIASEFIAMDDAGALAEGLIGRHAQLRHGVEDAPVDGLEAVAHVRQRAADNDRHGILHVAGFHFMHQLRGHDRLIRESDVLRLVVLFVMCQGFSSLNWFAAYLKGFLLCYCGEQSAHGSPSGRAVTEGD